MIERAGSGASQLGASCNFALIVFSALDILLQVNHCDAFIPPVRRARIQCMMQIAARLRGVNALSLKLLHTVIADYLAHVAAGTNSTHPVTHLSSYKIAMEH